MSIPNIEILRAIWKRSRGDYAFVSTMKRGENGERGTWLDYPFQYMQAMPIQDQPHNSDLFFAPLRFNRNERKNETVAGPGVLFADLDDAPTDYGLIQPSVLWETSPGNRQGVWFLKSYNHDYQRWANLNKRLTHQLGADPGGWMGSKVLRVPESINWKRKAFGKVLDFEETRAYDTEWLDTYLVSAPSVQPSLTGEHPKEPTVRAAGEIIVSRWGDMSLRGRHMLMKERVRDRSLHIVKTAHELLNSGMSPEDVFVMIWWRPWNKWRLRNNPDLLWTEILNAQG